MPRSESKLLRMSVSLVQRNMRVVCGPLNTTHTPSMPAAATRESRGLRPAKSESSDRQWQSLPPGSLASGAAMNGRQPAHSLSSACAVHSDRQ